MSEEITEAVDVVARHAIARAAEPDEGLGQEVEWGNYPEIGMYDWEAVQARVNEIRRSLDPPQEAYEAAYALLESRTEALGRASGEDTSTEVAEAVLDAVLPQITTLEDFDAIPDNALLMADEGDGRRPDFYQWWRGLPRNLLDEDFDFGDTPQEMLENYKLIQVVWKP